MRRRWQRGIGSVLFPLGMLLSTPALRAAAPAAKAAAPAVEIVRVEYALLPAQNPSLATARAAYAAGQFLPLPARRLPTTAPGQHLWVRLEWENPGARLRWVALEILDFFEDRSVLYLEQTEGGIFTTLAGENVPYPQRSLWGREPVFLFSTPPAGRFVTWINNENDNSPWPLYRVHDPADEFLRARRVRDTWIGVYYGVLMALATYSLFVYAVLKRHEILYYLLHVATFGAGFALYQNLHHEYLPWLISPHLNLLLALLLCLAMITLVQFSRRFLAIETYSARMERVLRRTIRVLAALAAFCALYEAAILVDRRVWDATLPFYQRQFAGFALVCVAVFTLLTTMGAQLWRRGCRQARFYVTGFGGAFLFIVPAALSQIRLTPVSADFRWVQIGSALEMTMFAMAIADKIRLMRIEKDEAVLRAKIEAAERTRLQLAHQEILRQKQMLEELNKQKSEFLGIAAHDLKSPLSVLSGFAELLLEDNGANAPSALSPEERRHYLTTMTQSSRRMLKLIDTLLRTEAIESGRIALEPDTYALADLVESAWHILEPAAAAKDITAIFRVPANLHVHVDAQRFTEVLDNLLSNAMKFSPRGSHVEVAAAPAVDARGEPASPPAVHLTIADSGPGFSAEDRPKLFGRYCRLSAPPTAGEASTGLGLFIVRRLVELQGGSVTLVSPPDHSAVFKITIPAGGPKPRLVQKNAAGSGVHAPTAAA